MTIQAAWYGENIKALMADPIVKAMADSIPDEHVAGLVHDNGHPTFTFMIAAKDRYLELGGTQSESIGAVALAVLALKDN